MSRANEERFTQLPNDVLDALSRADLTVPELKAALVICRQTYGYHRESVWISLGTFQRATARNGGSSINPKGRSNVHRALRLLELNRVIVIQTDNKRKPKYRINREINEWLVLSTRITRKDVFPSDNMMLSKRTKAVFSSGTTQVLSTRTPIKETLKENSKESIKESAPPDPHGGDGQRFQRRSNGEAIKELSDQRNLMARSGIYSVDELIGLKSESAQSLKEIHEAMMALRHHMRRPWRGRKSFRNISSNLTNSYR